MNNICKAKTTAGKKCSKVAGPSGFCKQHDKIIKEYTKKQKYNQIIDTILNVCRIKSWKAKIESEDNEYQFATIHVSKFYSYHEIKGILDISFTDVLKYTIQPTSPNNYGLKELFDAISIKIKELKWMENRKGLRNAEQPRPSQVLLTILRNFDKSARQIQRRYNNRKTIEIEDEYDVQDLMHAILRAFFNDVRPEEYTPSYAGSNSRVDFLLKTEKIVIEVKFASQKLKEKEIGNQLIIDINKYQTHPDCEQLYCFVYDPNREIRNPVGIENDLSGKQNKIEVIVLVVPH